MPKLALLVCVLIAFGTVAVKAQEAPNKEDLILGKLDQLIKLLTDPTEPEQPSRVKVDITSLPATGADYAPLTLIEFTDLECPFCAKFHTETYPKLKQAFIDTGKVQFVHWDMPLVSIHPHALFAAQVARCAGEQRHFWEMRDWIIGHPKELELEPVMHEAIWEMKLDAGPFRRCVATAQYKEAVEKQAAEASGDWHLSGTPSFAIGKTDFAIDKTPIIDGEVIRGAVPYQVFEEKIKALLQ